MTVKLTEQQELEVEICFVQRELELLHKPNPTLVSVLSQLRTKHAKLTSTHAKLTSTNYVNRTAVPA
jgi:hypothetical protein